MLAHCGIQFLDEPFLVAQVSFGFLEKQESHCRYEGIILDLRLVLFKQTLFVEVLQVNLRVYFAEVDFKFFKVLLMLLDLRAELRVASQQFLQLGFFSFRQLIFLLGYLAIVDFLDFSTTV